MSPLFLMKNEHEKPRILDVIGPKAAPASLKVTTKSNLQQTVRSFFILFRLILGTIFLENIQL